MRTTPLLASLALALASCGGAADPAGLNSEGYAALGSGNYEAAAGHFQSALDALGTNTSDAQYERAMLGLIDANAHVDPDAAQADFLAYAAASSTLSADEYGRVGKELANAKAFTQAVAVVDAGIQAHPETPALMTIMEMISEEAKKSGDTGALDAMAGLGYLGD